MRKTLLAQGCALAAVLALAGQAPAQELTVFGTGASDGDGTNIQLVGVSLRPEGLGLKPVVGLQVYRLGYDLVPEGSATVYAVTPSAGLQYRGTGGAVEGRVGYNFQDRSEDSPFIEGEGGGSGLTTTLLASSWASRPELQGVASYSWNSDFLWTQGQATIPVANLNPGSVGVGAEAIYQTETRSDLDYHALQLGPVLRYNNGRNLIIQLGAGWKNPNVGDDTYYARLTVVSYGVKV
jgi:hypothetical protein